MPHTEHSAVPVNPSDVACIDLINSAFTDYLGGDAAEDRVASKEWRRWFLDRYELEPTVSSRPPIEQLVTLRRDLRRVLEKWARGEVLSARDARVLDGRIRASALRLRVAATAEGLELVEEPVRRDWLWVLASVTASAVELMRTGDPQRLKTCTNPNCSWMFYDSTVNRSKRFCSTTPCATLIRVRRFREDRDR